MFPGNVRLLVWDLDGVLFYVRNSYRLAITESVQYFFSGLMGLDHLNPLISPEDTQKFKYIEGFNDDWKLTYALVLCFLADLAKGRSLPKAAYPLDLAGTRLALSELGAVSRDWEPSIDLQDMAEKIKASGKGLAGTELALCGSYGRNVVSEAKRFWYTDAVKKVFQELYLGEELYRMKYSEECSFFHVPGFIRDELSLVSREALEELGSRFYMGIASGRERFEIEYSLKLHDLDSFFPKDLIISSDDVKHGKPDPESLLFCRKRAMGKYGLMGEDACAAYIGDSVDDVRASKNADFYSIGVLSALEDAGERKRLCAEFEALHCDLILEDAGKLVKILS